MVREARHTAPGVILGLLAAAVVAVGCGSGAGDYAGAWTRELSGEGEVTMRLASNGEYELELPAPRWPDSVDMKGSAAFDGDTMIFAADTSAMKCATSEARFLVNREGDQLSIRGLGMDNCGGRRAALVGTWTKA